ncbi:MAG TPA: 50S ribosomal protein L15, partial [Candidatus Baltobacteraceae bacterium]|nr:50S ribosomal protein L15 [Candidatus Baltobacteraceae bacterium]
MANKKAPVEQKERITLGNLEPVPGSRRRPIRLGMGEGSGTGQTATRGQKGQRSRSGDGKLVGFEGGQTPLIRRIPKRGFTNGLFKVVYQVIDLGTLDRVFSNKAEISIEDLRIQNLIKGRKPVKILADGELKRAIKISAHGFS